MSDARSFTVVIPTRARPRRLALCLAALTRLDYPGDRYDVVVVDDGGMMNAADQASLRKVARGMPLTIVRMPHRGPGPARNRGVQAASGEWLAFTDDDCRPEPGWLMAFAQTLRRQPDALVGGRTINGLPSNPFATASQDLVDFLIDWYSGYDGPRFFTSNNLAVARAAFVAAGGFDAAFVRTCGEDRELVERWCRLGLPRIRAAAAVVRHEHTMGLRGFLRQHVGYGRGAAHFRRALERAGAEPVRVEPLRFYSRMLAAPLRRHGAFQGAAVSALIAGTQAANFAGYLLETRKLRRTGRA